MLLQNVSKYFKIFTGNKSGVTVFHDMYHQKLPFMSRSEYDKRILNTY